MNRSQEKGMVLVACLLILVLLSILGAGSLLSSSLNAQMVGNLTRHGEAFYAAEAGLDVAVGRILNGFRLTLTTYAPDAQWHAPSTADGDPYDGSFNGYNTSFRISNAMDPNHPATEPQSTDYSTVQDGETLLHHAYLYQLQGKADGVAGSQILTETLRVLETPLVQYYVFYDDDLSIHSGLGMTCWGRIHTNGNLYLAALEGLQFQNYDTENNLAPNQLTVGGEVIRGYLLGEGPRGTKVARAPDTMQLRVANLGTIPSGNLNADSELLDKSINAANQGTEQERFKDAGNNYHVKIKAEKYISSPIASIKPGGFYDLEAAAPRKPGVDGLRIVLVGGALRVLLSLQGGAATDVTELVWNYQVDPGVSADVLNWPADARTRADGSLVSAINPPFNGTMVYSPERIVRRDEANPAADFYTTARGATSNPRYPCVLERQDPREVREVDFTVVDLQRLELWYNDYLDWRDNNALDDSNASLLSPWHPRNRRLLIYVTRNGAAPTTNNPAPALQAVKVIGSRAGRTRGNGMAANRQTAATALAPTTLVTNHPLYVDGDFNAPAAGAAPSNQGPGQFGVALISDATTLLSNLWGNLGGAGLDATYGKTSGTYTKPRAFDTAYNAAFFTGRYKFTDGNARSGSNGANEAGVHNLLRFIEDWSTPNGGVSPDGSTYFFTGSLVNIWFSEQANRDFVCCGTGATDVYNRPVRFGGWDVSFANRDYWPPYVPSIYTVERVSWQEQ